MIGVRVRAPASTANLGPGFDCLSLALALYLDVEMQAVESGLHIELDGEGADELPRDDQNLVAQASLRAFEALGRRPPGIRILIRNSIPLGSGLGSSSAAVVAGILAGNALAGGDLSTRSILRLAMGIEGHADNAAASLYGGFNLIVSGRHQLLVRQLPIAEFRVVVAVPELSLPTQEMRRLLPDAVPLDDAVHNLAHSILLVEAIRLGDYSLLQAGMRDRLHEPYRRGRIPSYTSVAQAAASAGAAGVALSGAGPSLIAFAREGLAEIGRAMAAAFEAQGLPSRWMVLEIDRQGSTLESLEA